MYMKREKYLKSLWELFYDDLKRENNSDKSINKDELIELLKNIRFQLKHTIIDIKKNNKICDVYKDE